MDAMNSAKIRKVADQAPDIVPIASDALGIYISIPFCRAKCSYCNFASGVFGDKRMSAYVDRLTAEIREIHVRAEKWSALLPEIVDTLYFGGGTPSLLSIHQLQEIVKAIHDGFFFAPEMEATLECAPGQLNDELLQALPGLGFNRVSLGVQSFVDQETKAVGRRHTSAVVLDDISRLRCVGIENINMDLIAGLPGQTRESWRTSLEQAIDSGVPHLSVYMLDVDEDSRLGREMIAGGTRYGVGLVPNDEQIAGMYTEACERLDSAGIAQYEISNFARPGHESRHNLKYWLRQPYLGFGLDAHSLLSGQDGEQIRISATDDLQRYLHNGAQESITPVSAESAMEEAGFLGLRLANGVSLAAMQRNIGSSAMAAFQPVLRQCIDEGLLECNGGNVRLTARGKLFANEAFERFLGVLDMADRMEQEGVPA